MKILHDHVDTDPRQITERVFADNALTKINARVCECLRLERIHERVGARLG